MRHAVAAYRLLVVFFALVGTYRATTFVDPSNWVFWTTQTNLLIAVVFAWAVLAAYGRLPEPPGWLRGLATMGIIVTGVVANTILPPPSPTEPRVLLGLTTTTMAHIIVPIGATVDFIAFAPHRALRPRYALAWLAYPLAYFAMAMIRGAIWPELGYPYFFVDLSVLGWSGIARSIVTYLPAMYVLGLALVGLDRVLPARPLVGASTAGSFSGTTARDSTPSSM